MLLPLELFTAILGITILHREVIRNRFHNYATSVFLICFVPLFCVYPVAARIVIGGAYAVGKFNEEIVPDPIVYLIYQLFCIGTLATVAMTMPKTVKVLAIPGWTDKYSTNILELGALTGIALSGVFLFIYSTGMSIGDLISGSRFGWFNEQGYSSGLFVVSTYLFALSPVALLLCFANTRYRWPATIGIIAVLVLYGLVTKDRKWLIYIMSASLGYLYVSNQFSIKIHRNAIIIGGVALLAMIFWQVFRGVLFNYYLTGNGDISYEIQKTAIDLLTKGDLPYYYNASITAIDMNLNFDFGIPFGIVRRQLLFFLPADYSLGLKVEDISALFSDAIGGEDSTRRGNMPPGYFGLFAISFGWFGGIAACSLMPLAIRALDRVIQRNRGLGSIVLLAHMFSSVLLLLRGDDSSATYFIISSTLFIYIARPKLALSTQSSHLHRSL